jgi:hypothetical protein
MSEGGEIEDWTGVVANEGQSEARAKLDKSKRETSTLANHQLPTCYERHPKPTNAIPQPLISNTTSMLGRTMGEGRLGTKRDRVPT